MVDSCTFWFEGTWSACCAIHDSMYASQFVSKIEADVALVRCVAEHGGWPMALVMGVGVVVLGLPFWTRAQIKRKR